MSNDLDQHYFGPELAPNCLQISTADDTKKGSIPRQVHAMNVGPMCIRQA